MADAEHIQHGWPYESVMRPYIDQCQDLPDVYRRLPAETLQRHCVSTQVMKWMQRWRFRSYAEKKWFTTTIPR